MHSVFKVYFSPFQDENMRMKKKKTKQNKKKHLFLLATTSKIALEIKLVPRKQSGKAAKMG